MREKPDHYSIRAKKEGYPARSVYKLEEIQNKFGIIKPGHKILDIGASPGSWSIYALKLIKGRGSVTAVDLKPMNFGTRKPSTKNFHSIQGDAFTKETIETLKLKGPYNLVMSDAAPSTTGNRTVDAGRSFSLAENVVDLASGLLIPGGSLVIKIFQGGDEHEILDRIRVLFTKAKILKPKACRKNSFETYLIGTEFKSSR